MKSCHTSWRLIFLSLLIIVCRTNAQFYEQPETAVKYQPPQFNDPIRRALGLWSRLLNRMSQPNDPTDDQLHLRIQDGDKSAFEDLELPALFGNLNQRRDKNARQPPIQSASNSIINEERLNQLLPRIRQETTEAVKTTTEALKSTTAEMPKELKFEENDEKEIEKEEKSVKKSKSKEKLNEKDENKEEPKKKKNSSKNKSHTESSENNDSKNKQNSRESQEDRNTSSAENESSEGDDEIRTTTSKKLVTMSTTKKLILATTTKRPTTKKSEEPKSTTISSTKKSTLSSKSTTIQVSTKLSTKLSTQKPSTTKTKLKAVLHVDQNDNGQKETTTPIQTTLTTEPTTKMAVTRKSKPIKHVSTESYDSELLEVTQEDDANELDGSGEEPESEEPIVSNMVVIKGKVTRAKNKDATTKSHPITTTKSIVTKSSTKPIPSTTTTTESPIESTTESITEETIEPPASTEKLQTRKKTIKKEETAEYSEEKEIPEAEEAEFQTDEQPMTTTIVNNEKSTEDDTTGANYSAESKENERKMEKIMTPVSSIIDGIGPLILPLLGYSRQTIGGILNPGLAAVANSGAARAAGVRNFRPQQVPTNPQVLRQPNPRQQLDGSQPFQQVIAPFQQGASSSFQQAPTARKSYGPKQHKMKNYQIEAISLPPADFYNNRQRVTEGENSNSANGLGSFVQTRSSAPDLRDPTQASILPVGQNPTYNRMVNADTAQNGYAQRYIPDPPNLQQQKLSQIDQGAMMEVYRQILARRGLKGPSLRGVNEDQLAQIAQLAAQIPKNQNNFVKINPASNPPPEIRKKASVDDPGYQMGRSNVVSSFYEDSGIMVGANPAAPPASEPTSNSVGSSGFGGGRRPDSSFEQVAVATLDDERLFI